ncbi:MAG: glycosyltransferase [Deltaproteobacteria bacterium]|nr:glycosyltransferase [Deltaproteobacteria bacterium]
MGKRKSREKIKNKKPTISLCMIVRNEEACLGRCLDSVRHCVDEMIVVDTGSTDRTVEIAKKYGAKVFYHPWENDFSKHRNQSLSYATGDWILQLDADEELFADAGPILSETVQKGDADYCHCLFYDVDQNGVVQGVFNLIRLFRNGLSMFFTQKIHNQLQVVGTGAFSHIRVKHYGYDLSPEKMEEKHIRTTTLLKEMLEQNPEDVYCRHQLAASYSLHKDYETAIDQGLMALDVMRKNGLRNDYFLTTFYLVAQAYFSLEQYESAKRICLEAIALFPLYLDVYHILAAVYFKKEALAQCRAMSLKYLHLYDELQKNPSLIGSGSCYCFNPRKRSEIFMGLACIHFFEKDFEGADAFFCKSLEDSADPMDKTDKITRFYFEQKMDAKAMEWLMKAYETGCSRGSIPDILQEKKALYAKIAETYLANDHVDSALACFEKAGDESLTEEERFAKKLSQAGIFWRQGKVDDLVGVLEDLITALEIHTISCVDSIEDLGRIVYDIAEAFCLRQQWHPAEPALQLAVKIAPNLFDRSKFERLLHHAESPQSSRV